MTRLSRQQHDLSTMMSLVRDEVVQKVDEIGREILPRSPGNDAASSHAELEQSDGAVAASRQRAQELWRANAARIDGPWDRDTMLRAHHLDPHASGIVDVGRDRPHRPAWNAGNGCRPHRGRQVLDEIHRHAIVRSPGGDQRAMGLEFCWHIRSLRLRRLDAEPMPSRPGFRGRTRDARSIPPNRQ